jgi:hypothetical protein
LVDQGFHRPPGVDQGYAAIVDDLTVLISGVLIVARLECERRVHEVEIDIVESESVKTCQESGRDPFRSVIGVPQLCRDKDVLAFDRSGSQACVQCFANFAFIAIPLRAVEVSESGFQCTFGRPCREHWI